MRQAKVTAARSRLSERARFLSGDSEIEAERGQMVWRSRAAARTRDEQHGIAAGGALQDLEQAGEFGSLANVLGFGIGGGGAQNQQPAEGFAACAVEGGFIIARRRAARVDALIQERGPRGEGGGRFIGQGLKDSGRALDNDLIARRAGIEPLQRVSGSGGAAASRAAISKGSRAPRRTRVSAT